MLRVVHVTPVIEPITGGIERFIHDLAVYGQRSGLTESTIVQTVDGDGAVAPSELDGVPIRRVRCGGIAPMRTLPDMREHVEGADVIHLHDPQVAGITWHFTSRKYGPPLVLTTHGGFFHTPRLRRAKEAYFRYAVPRLLRRVDMVIASSTNDEKTYTGVASRLRRIDNGIDFAAFNAIADRVPATSASMVYFGRLAKNKRIDRLIPLVSALRARGVDATLDIVGIDFDDLEAELKRSVSSLGLDEHVRFHGVLDEAAMREVIARARFVVSASEYEGFGLGVVEGMAAGRIPLLNPIPPFRSLVSDGRNGFLVDFTDSDVAADRVAGIARSDSAMLDAVREAAIERARDFSWSRRVTEYVDTYRDAIESHARDR